MYEKMPTPYSRRITPVTVYLEELKQILQVFETERKAYDLMAKAQDGSIYKFDNLGELSSQIGRSTTYLNIDSHDAEVFIWLEPDITAVEARNQETVTLGLCEKIVSILQRCRRRFYWLRLPSKSGIAINISFLLLSV